MTVYSPERDWIIIGPLALADYRQGAIEYICELHGVTVSDLKRKCRKASLVKARYHLMWLFRMHAGWSLPKIGFWFNRDHSTVVHGIATHQKVEDEKRRQSVVDNTLTQASHRA